MMYQDSGAHAFQRGRASRKCALSRIELEDVDERGKGSAGWTTQSTCSRVALAEAFRPKAEWMDGQTGASDAADLEKPKTLVSFRVLVGNKVCFNWYILPVEDGPNFDWALESISFASKNGGCFSSEISP